MSQAFTWVFKHLLKYISSNRSPEPTDSGSDDELWNQLEDEIENDSTMAALREQRMEQLKHECVIIPYVQPHLLIEELLDFRRFKTYGKVTMES